MPRLEGTLQLSDSARETNSPWELKAASDHAGQLGETVFQPFLLVTSAITDTLTVLVCKGPEPEDPAKSHPDSKLWKR